MKLEQMANEVWDFCEAKGWEPDPERTFDEEIALIHSEISEALEEYRDHGLKPYVIDPMPGNTEARYVLGQTYGDLKPLGVPSELADILVRWLHYAKKRELDFTVLQTQHEYWTLENFESNTQFGFFVAQLHKVTSRCYMDHLQFNGGVDFSLYGQIFNLLKSIAAYYKIDLEAEFNAKMEYNRTRSYRHGGKKL